MAALIDIATVTAEHFFMVPDAWESLQAALTQISRPFRSGMAKADGFGSSVSGRVFYV